MEPGPNGAGALASFTFSALRNGIGLLDLTSVKIVDIQGKRDPPRERRGRFGHGDSSAGAHADLYDHAGALADADGDADPRAVADADGDADLRPADADGDADLRAIADADIDDGADDGSSRPRSANRLCANAVKREHRSG